MKLFNSHTHTNISSDCTSLPEDMVKSAIDAGLRGISITDHCSASNYISYNTYAKAKKSTNLARRLNNKYSDKIQIFAGIEFEEMLWHPEYAKRVLDSLDFDVVLASVHKVQKCPYKVYISRVDFSKFSQADLQTYAKWYFDETLETAAKCDYDVLSHITLLLRYVSVKYNRTLDMNEFKTTIDEILKTVANREKALEINTSEINTLGLIPNEEIIRRFKALGGKFVTIGSDAHYPNDISKGLIEAVNVLKSCGFEYYVYYENRQVQKVYI